MKTLHVPAALILFVASTAIASAQTAEQLVTPPSFVVPAINLGDSKYQKELSPLKFVVPTTKPGGSRSKKELSPLKPVVRDLRLRGGAVATGLTGFYDYQSNGGSPGYIAIHRGTPEYIVTTSMSSSDGSSIDAANAGRRVGYAYSGNGGTTWVSTSSIMDVRLGFPYLQLGTGGLPFIAAHGDLGAGDRAFIFASSEVSSIDNFFPLAELPLRTQSGRDGGVAWPAFTLTKSGDKSVVLGSYSNEDDQPLAPLQVATVSMGDGTTQDSWSNLTDSLSSITSGGRAIIARSATGRLGAAWFRFALDSNDNTWGVYYAESIDDGQTWSTATPVLTGEQMFDAVNINGDIDTLSAGANLDLAFRGEEPQLVFTGSINNRLQFANVMYWSPSTGAEIIVMSHQEPGLGAYSLPLTKRQQNMGSIAFPTVSVGDDGKHVVVAFSAVSQIVDESGTFTDDAVSEHGFQYYRIWGVGSSDGGRNWGRPFIIQDLAEKGTDSASVEYPSAPELSRVTNGTFELPLVFQARRYPGMYTFTGAGESTTDAGPISECTQYFQSFTVTPAMFRSTAASMIEDASSLRASIYPNTTASDATLELELPTASSIDVVIVDALGRHVSHPITSRHYYAGTHSMRINAGSLAAGSYHCIVRHDAGVVTRRLEVIR